MSNFFQVSEYHNILGLKVIKSDTYMLRTTLILRSKGVYLL